MSKVVGTSSFVGRRCPLGALPAKPIVCRGMFAVIRRRPGVTRRVCRTLTRATEGGDKAGTGSNPQPAAPEGTTTEKQTVPLPPPPSESEEEMGVVGQILAWGLLSVLFAASIFFTFSRQFLPDLVPLDMNNPPL